MHRTPHALARSSVIALLLSLAACGPESHVEPKTEDGSGHVQEALASTPTGSFRNGIITFYDATGAGACSFDASPEDMNVTAIGEPDYAGSAACGSCAEVEGPLGTVKVRIVDLCPGCAAGHLDLSRQAFAKIANPIDGRVNVRWRMVTCDVQGPIRYHLKEGSSQWWTAIQVLNHRLPVTKLEYWKNGAWVNVKREDYNYFVETSGMGSGAIKVRVTASDGQTLEDTLPGANPNATYDGAAQFKAG